MEMDRVGIVRSIGLGLLLLGCNRSAQVELAPEVPTTITAKPMTDRPIAAKSRSTPGIEIHYGPASRPFNRTMRQLLLRSQRLERLVKVWRSSQPTIGPVTIAAMECERPELRQPQSGRIELCYDLLGYLDNSFRDLSGSPTERESGVLDTMSLWLSREVVRNQGPTEDSAAIDRRLLGVLAQGEGPAIAMAGLQWTYNQGKPEPTLMALPYWHSNGFSLAQYDRLVCQIYRRSPRQFPFLAAEYGREKLDRCDLPER